MGDVGNKAEHASGRTLFIWETIRVGNVFENSFLFFRTENNFLT